MLSPHLGPPREPQFELLQARLAGRLSEPASPPTQLYLGYACHPQQPAWLLGAVERRLGWLPDGARDACMRLQSLVVRSCSGKYVVRAPGRAVMQLRGRRCVATRVRACVRASAQPSSLTRPMCLLPPLPSPQDKWEYLATLALRDDMRDTPPSDALALLLCHLLLPGQKVPSALVFLAERAAEPRFFALHASEQQQQQQQQRVP
jgi:hypothetical protein